MTEEKIFIINLRREFIKKPLYRRAKKSVTAVKEFISKHLKVKEVKIGNILNQHLWSRGKRHPPAKVSVQTYIKENIAYVELKGFKFEEFKIAEKEPIKETENKVKAVEETKKEQEKELLKEIKKEKDIGEKKEHYREIIEKPTKGVKIEEKVIKDIKKHGRVIGDTGKKPARK